MTIKRIVWSESFHEEETKAGRLSEFEYPIDFYEAPLQDIEASELNGPLFITIRTHSQLTPQWIDQAEGILTRSTGYDHIPMQDVDCPVGYLPDYATQAVADHNLTVSMALLRNLPQAMKAVEHFNRHKLTGHEIGDMTVGIYGVGRIGKASAKRFSSLGSNVIGFDIEEDSDWASSLNFSYVDRRSIFEQSELLILCLPFTNKTDKTISRRNLMAMPKNSYLVNSGRGEVVYSEDIYYALTDGPLDGVAVDVFNREAEVARQLSKDNLDSSSLDDEVLAGLKLVRDDRVVSTPHNAFNTEEALMRKVKRSLENIEHFLETDTLLQPVPGD